MRKLRLYLALIIISLFAAESGASPQIYKSNVLTARHVDVPGTHVAVVPPSGAVASAKFAGFEIASRGVQYEITEKMGAPYSSSKAELTVEALQKDGIRLLDTTDVVLNERPAYLLTCTSVQETQAQAGAPADVVDVGLLIFVLGDERLTTFIYGYYPLDDPSAASAIRNSMLTAIFDPQRKESPSGGYTLSSAGTSFKFADEANMTRYYTVGEAPATAALEAAIYSATELRQQVPPANRRAFAVETFERYLSEYEYEMLSERDISYGGLAGIEMTASFEGGVRRSRTASGGIVRRSMPGRGYQAVLFGNDGRVFVFQGVAVRDALDYLSQFGRITSTFALQK